MAYEFDVKDYLGEDPSNREPIHTADINGATMRFFASKQMAVDLPWIPARDIGAICGFDQKTANLITIAAVNRWSEADIVRAIKIGSKKEIVFPYLAALALLMQIVEDGTWVFDESLLPQFYKASAAATRAIVVPLAPTAGSAFELTLVATRNAVAPPGFKLEICTRPVDDDDDDKDADDEPTAHGPRPKAPEYA